MRYGIVLIVIVFIKSFYSWSLYVGLKKWDGNGEADKQEN